MFKKTTWGIDSTHKIWWHDINVGSMLEERHFCVKGVWRLICWLALLKVIVWDVFFQYRYVQWNYETWDHTSPRLRIFGLLLVVVVCCLFSGVLWFLTWHLVEIPFGDSLQAFDLYYIYNIMFLEAKTWLAGVCVAISSCSYSIGKWFHIQTTWVGFPVVCDD